VRLVFCAEKYKIERFGSFLALGITVLVSVLFHKERA